MNGKPNNSVSDFRYRPQYQRQRRPFWLPASNYYFLVAGVAIAFFFLAWGILHDGREETPWITAGMGAGVLLILAVILREVILRNARNRYLANQRRLDRSLKSAVIPTGTRPAAAKLTIEQNAAIIRAIAKKSEAAKVFASLSDGHREVSDMCREYLSLNAAELARVSVGSPRLPALRKGREVVQGMHHRHLLQWAEIEVRTLTTEARSRAKVNDKIETARRALAVIDAALADYPNEPDLLDSEAVIREFIVSIKVSDWIEKAEKAEFKGNYKRAQALYRDALFYLNREKIASNESLAAAEKIAGEIQRLETINS